MSWDPEDRAKAVAYYMEKNARCYKCGTADWEWDPDQGGSKFAYEAVENFCPGCLRIENGNEDIGDRKGISVTLIKTGTPEYLRRQKVAEERWLEQIRAKAAGHDRTG